VARAKPCALPGGDAIGTPGRPARNPPPGKNDATRIRERDSYRRQRWHRLRMQRRRQGAMRASTRASEHQPTCAGRAGVRRWPCGYTKRRQELPSQSLTTPEGGKGVLAENKLSPPSIPPRDGLTPTARRHLANGYCSPTRWVHSGSSPTALEPSLHLGGKTLEAWLADRGGSLPIPPGPNNAHRHAILDRLHSPPARTAIRSIVARPIELERRRGDQPRMFFSFRHRRRICNRLRSCCLRSQKDD